MSYTEIPDEFYDNYFANPLTLSVRPLLTEVLTVDGAQLSTGEPVLEIGVSRRFRHFESHRDAVQEFLGDLALDIADSVAYNDEVPKYIVGYTFQQLGTIAARLYGFGDVRLALSEIPEPLASDPLYASYYEMQDSLLHSPSGKGNPCVIGMRTARFLERYYPRE